MDKPNLLSRRMLLKQAPVVVAAVALPAATVTATAADDVAGLCGLPLASVHIDRAIAAMAEPGVPSNWSVTIHSGQPDQSWGFRRNVNEVAGAISRHKRAAAAHIAAIEAELDIEAALVADPKYPRCPKVQYSRLIQGRNPDGSNEFSPLFAYSIEELDEQCRIECATGTAIFGGRTVDRTHQRYDDLKVELARQVRRKQRMERRSGLRAADRATRKASREEESAALAVILAKPRNEAERKIKRYYMRGKDSFNGRYWDGQSLMAALLLTLQGRGL